MADATSTKPVALQQLDAAGNEAGNPPTKDPSDGKVEVTLAHHMNLGEDGNPSGVDNPGVKSVMPGAKIRVTRAVASAIIHAGYAQVHPDDSEAVAKILG